MAGIVALLVLSPETRSERRFDLHLTIGELKAKLELIAGIPIPAQRLSAYRSEDDANASTNVLAVLDDDARPLGFYGLERGTVLKVTDVSPGGASLVGQFSDVSRVEKFELTDGEYEQRQDTVRAYKQRHQIGRFAPKPSSDAASPPPPSIPPDLVAGARCEVIVDHSAATGSGKRGTIRFVGETKFGTGGGMWIGIEYDEPLGKNDGSVEGEQYFTCRPSFGAFVRPDKVRVGDFPVEDLELDDEDMEM